jgi:hypothetical protein
MKKIYPLALVLMVFTSCVSVGFPEEIKVHLEFPENLSEENISQIIDKIPPVLAKRKIKTQVEIISKVGPRKQQSVKEESLQKN